MDSSSSPYMQATGLGMCEQQPPLFCYSEKDVTESLARRMGSSSGQSKLNKLLCERWDGAMSRGLFRYDLSDVVTRHVPGKYGFVVQRNPKRFTHRRSPANIISIRQEFDHSLFNFNKIVDGEIVLRLCHGGCSPISSKEELCHMIVINVSPITKFHSLLIPDPNSCLPQVWTEDSIKLCLEVLALSNHSGFCIVANSLLGLASVNHLHYHILHVAEPVLASTVRGYHLGNCVYEVCDHPCPSFGFELLSSTQDCARDIFKVVHILLEHNYPHNMVILRGDSFNQTKPDGQTIRVLVTPRKPFYGAKFTSKPLFAAAACELVQGFIPIIDDSRFETITEHEILQIFQEYILSKDEFNILAQEVKSNITA